MKEERLLEELIQRKRANARLMEQELGKKKCGSLYIKRRGGKVYFAEYKDGKQKWITKDKKHIYEVARFQYVKRKLEETREIIEVLTDAEKKLKKKVKEHNVQNFADEYPMLDERMITLSPEESSWCSRYEVNPYKPESKRYRTAGGIGMRSKSERMIGNVLEEYGIPYRYEAELIIDGKAYYPDFTIMCSNGNIIIWEHLGMMDMEEYRMRALLKIIQYRRLGFKQTSNLICTWEEDLDDLDYIDDIIARYIINPPKV